MMENRSFDHFLGWLPGADGCQAGLRYADKTGTVHPTHRLAPDFQGCGFADPEHSFEGGRIEYDNGKCDGWLRAGSNDLYSIGYYTRPDLAFLGQVAPSFASPDRYFPAILGPTFPNRIFQHAGQTDRLSNTLAVCTLPTIWDSLAQARLSGKYYFSDLPVLGLWGQKYTSISRPVKTFFGDAAAGNLPAVAYIDPSFIGENQGVSNVDHPQADIRNGEVFLDSIYRAVTTGPAWHRTVLVINYDEWGGFFDHVPPPPGPVTDAERILGYTDGLRGFRVPCLVVSPWSQHGRVPHAVYDHTSILKMIEWRFGLQPLSVRDAAARNLANVLDFDRPRFEVPQPDVQAGPFGGACPPSPPPSSSPAVASAVLGTASSDELWPALLAMARDAGFPSPN
jgi:phospholipase C